MKHPEHLTTAHLAILGKTGSGKTYAAKGIVEALIKDGRRVCIIDPTGAWWGLKSSADGKHPGLPVTVLGGEDEYRDLPLSDTTGAPIAALVGSGDLGACVLDLSALSIGGQHRFVTAFLEELYRVNRGVLHLVIDEADEFAPQSGAPGTERVLGATARIVQRGRLKGFRVMLISQRPAVLNKRVLTQCNAMVAMRLPAPQDRKAIEEWVKGQADETQARDLLASLSGLARGEGWVWAPEHGLLDRRKFPTITTFDSGKTPDGNESEARTSWKFADIDLSKLNAALAESIKEAEQNDPAKLRARIKELERENGKVAPAVDVEAIRASVRREEAQRMRLSVQTLLARIGALCTLEALEAAEHDSSAKGLLLRVNGDTDGNRLSDVVAKTTARPARESAPAAVGNLSNRVLWALAFWRALGQTPSREQVAAVIGYHARSKGFLNTLGSLRTGGLIDYDGEGVILTDAGKKTAPHVHRTENGGAVELVASNLSGRPLEIFRIIAAEREVGRQVIASRLGLHERSKGFLNDLGKLSGRGLVTYERNGMVKLAGFLND